MLFPAHVDTWFIFVFYGGSLAFLALGFALWRKSKGPAALSLALGLVFSAVSFDAQSVKYEVANGLLRVTGGLFAPASTIAPVARITRVAPTNDGSAGRAPSLERRLRVEWEGGGSALISPDDVDGFLAALTKADAALVREGSALVRH